MSVCDDVVANGGSQLNGENITSYSNHNGSQENICYKTDFPGETLTKSVSFADDVVSPTSPIPNTNDNDELFAVIDSTEEPHDFLTQENEFSDDYKTEKNLDSNAPLASPILSPEPPEENKDEVISTYDDPQFISTDSDNLKNIDQLTQNDLGVKDVDTSLPFPCPSALAEIEQSSQSFSLNKIDHENTESIVQLNSEQTLQPVSTNEHANHDPRLEDELQKMSSSHSEFKQDPLLTSQKDFENQLLNTEESNKENDKLIIDKCNDEGLPDVLIEKSNTDGLLMDSTSLLAESELTLQPVSPKNLESHILSTQNSSVAANLQAEYYQASPDEFKNQQINISAPHNVIDANLQLNSPSGVSEQSSEPLSPVEIKNSALNDDEPNQALEPNLQLNSPSGLSDHSSQPFSPVEIKNSALIDDEPNQALEPNLQLNSPSGLSDHSSHPLSPVEIKNSALMDDEPNQALEPNMQLNSPSGLSNHSSHPLSPVEIKNSALMDDEPNQAVDPNLQLNSPSGLSDHSSQLLSPVEIKNSDPIDDEPNLASEPNLQLNSPSGLSNQTSQPPTSVEIEKSQLNAEKSINEVESSLDSNLPLGSELISPIELENHELIDDSRKGIEPNLQLNNPSTISDHISKPLSPSTISESEQPPSDEVTDQMLNIDHTIAQPNLLLNSPSAESEQSSLPISPNDVEKHMLCVEDANAQLNSSSSLSETDPTSQPMSPNELEYHVQNSEESIVSKFRQEIDNQFAIEKANEDAPSFTLPANSPTELSEHEKTALSVSPNEIECSEVSAKENNFDAVQLSNSTIAAESVSINNLDDSSTKIETSDSCLNQTPPLDAELHIVTDPQEALNVPLCDNGGGTHQSDYTPPEVLSNKLEEEIDEIHSNNAEHTKTFSNEPQLINEKQNNAVLEEEGEVSSKLSSIYSENISHKSNTADSVIHNEDLEISIKETEKHTDISKDKESTVKTVTTTKILNKKEIEKTKPKSSVSSPRASSSKLNTSLSKESSKSASKSAKTLSQSKESAKSKDATKATKTEKAIKEVPKTRSSGISSTKQAKDVPKTKSSVSTSQNKELPKSQNQDSQPKDPLKTKSPARTNIRSVPSKDATQSSSNKKTIVNGAKTDTKANLTSATSTKSTLNKAKPAIGKSENLPQTKPLKRPATAPPETKSAANRKSVAPKVSAEPKAAVAAKPTSAPVSRIAASKSMTVPSPNSAPKKPIATSKIGSLSKVTHKPGGGDVKIIDKKLNFKSNAVSKIGSLEKKAPSKQNDDSSNTSITK